MVSCQGLSQRQGLRANNIRRYSESKDTCREKVSGHGVGVVVCPVGLLESIVCRVAHHMHKGVVNERALRVDRERECCLIGRLSLQIQKVSRREALVVPRSLRPAEVFGCPDLRGVEIFELRVFQHVLKEASRGCTDT